MGLKFIAGIGWIDTDAPSPSRGGLSTVDAPDPTTVGTDNTGTLVTGNLIYTPATEGQYGATVNGVVPDPKSRTGTPGWVAHYFPEYIDESGNTFGGGGAKVIYGGKKGPGQVTITGSRGSAGMEVPWQGGNESYWKALNEEDRQKYFDSVNWFRNDGQGIDPRLLTDMVMDNPFAPKSQQTASNKYGTMTFGRGVTSDNPYGLNATFQGKDYAGNNYNWQQKHWGYVQQKANGQKYVPGWLNTARVIGDPSYRPREERNPWDSYFGNSSSGEHQAPWWNLEPGTNITGRYGWGEQGESTGFSGFGP